MGDLARILLDEIAGDPEALAQLRELVAPGDDSSSTAPAYTVRSLAAELSRSERSIRAAIARGELDAVRRGRGYLIGRDAVERWAQAQPARSRTPRARAHARGGGVMGRALR